MKSIEIEMARQQKKRKEITSNNEEFVILKSG